MLDEHDHRSLGQRLDLFHLQEEAPGMVFWHPRGYQLYRLIESRVRSQMQREGYSEVRTPQILAQPIWERSGHWENFRENMFQLADEGGRHQAVKPVNCPGHIQLVQRMAPSYRDLPLRLGEFGLVHRNREVGCRASVDARGESLSRKIVDAHQAGVPWLVVVGKREVEKNAVRLRRRDGEQRDLPWDEAVAALVAECRPAASA